MQQYILYIYIKRKMNVFCTINFSITINIHYNKYFVAVIILVLYDKTKMLWISK